MVSDLKAHGQSLTLCVSEKLLTGIVLAVGLMISQKVGLAMRMGSGKGSIDGVVFCATIRQYIWYGEWSCKTYNEEDRAFYEPIRLDCIQLPSDQVPVVDTVFHNHIEYQQISFIVGSSGSLG